ncbi:MULTISPECIES: NYN domain-containing protein [Thermomonospora]|uniref:Putative RNA-binding protein with PIN domain n=1 Tax=Thermomonospora cellulosilytica TaxID=1411118 RepID=A0A7W3RBW6_9ACTN|nr:MULTISPECIES: NYN domain-containing protein [Thermomonospora]MBA9006675.1 putative RNA-binding protein with PIN domain [Thermomonospora cellulosilytica]
MGRRRARRIAGREPGRSTIIDSGPETPGADPPERLGGPLPEAVRQQVVEAAAELIGTLPVDRIPPTLRPFARWERRKRARHAGRHIAPVLEKDAEFRAKVADRMRETEPELAAAVEAGTVPPIADPVTVAAIAYLLRPPGWPRLVEAARAELERSADAAEGAALERRIAVLQQELAAARAARTAELDRLRAELRHAKAEISDLRRRLHEERMGHKAARERAGELAAEAERERAAAREASAAADKELRRLRARLAEAEAAAELARRAAREGRNVDDVRLRMLLDTLVDAAQGVRRELALPSMIDRPADAVGSADPHGPAHRAVPGRALSDQDPRLLDRLLTLPQVHLIIDGYNVTKTGYGELPLADQRNRLVRALGGLAAQTGAEVTCVFDGAELEAPVPVNPPRGVRVRFSRPGQTADELIGELVRAEPPGRPVVVVSSDREVADAARRAEARPAPSTLLLRRLGRA